VSGVSGSEHQQEESRYFYAALAMIVVAAAWWRLTDLARPGLWLDEIFGVRGIGPEHGPLYYMTMRATTLAQPNEFLTRLPFALAGILGVAIAGLVGRSAAGSWLGIAVGAFVATSPVHLYYSREARPYAILILCGFVGLLAVAHLVRRWERPWLWLIALALAIGIAVFTSANGIFVVLSLVVAAVWTRPGLRMYALWLGIVLALAAASVFTVRSIYPPPGATASVLPTWQAVRDGVVPVLGPMVTGHLEQPAMRPVSWLGVGLALCGALAIGWRAPRLALALTTAAVAGLVLPVATMLWLQHFISARYALAMFPAFAILIAGPAALLDWLDGPWRRDGRWLVAAAALALLVLGSLQSDARRLALNDKADWRKVGAMVAERTRPGDLVVVSNDWSWVCLEYYLPSGGPQGRRIVNVHESLADAQRTVAGSPTAILVSGGDHFTSWEVPRWMSGFPRIWQTGREDIALSFYPDRRTYLASAVTPKEVAADEARLLTMLRSRIDMTVNARFLLVDGWHDAEVYRRDTPFRWADRRAIVYLPVSARWPTVLTTKVRPHPRLIDRRLNVLINGVLVSTTMLTDEWTDVRADIPRERLKAGANLIELQTSEPPAPYDRGTKAVQGIDLR
jgi:mannosyltransferase